MISVNDIDFELQMKLDKICKWANDWQLPISYTKCNVLEIGKPGGAQYRMDSWSVAQVKNVVDLGVTIDSKLKFSTHINGIAAKKAHKRANLIIRCFMSRDLTSLVRAFTIYVRPILQRAAMLALQALY